MEEYPRAESSPTPADSRTSSNTPTPSHTARRHDIVARTGRTCPTASTSQLSLSSPNCSPRPPRPKSSLAAPSKKRARSQTPLGTNSRGRGPLPSRLPNKCSTSDRPCRPRISRRPPPRPPRIFRWRGIVPRRHHWRSPHTCRRGRRGARGSEGIDHCNT